MEGGIGAGAAAGTEGGKGVEAGAEVLSDDVVREEGESALRVAVGTRASFLV